MNSKKLKECFVKFSVKTISGLKRSFGVILAIFGRFCKTEKARIGAISWVDIVRLKPFFKILPVLLKFGRGKTGRDYQYCYYRQYFENGFNKVYILIISEMREFFFKTLLDGPVRFEYQRSPIK